MKGLVSQVDTSSRFNALAEMAVVSIVSSAVRLPYSVMSLVFNILKYPLTANKPDCLKNMKIAVIGVGRSLVEWVPFLGNYVAIHLNVKEYCGKISLKNMRRVKSDLKFPPITRRLIAPHITVRTAAINIGGLSKATIDAREKRISAIFSKERTALEKDQIKEMRRLYFSEVGS
jgi:hypothetical protein